MTKFNLINLSNRVKGDISEIIAKNHILFSRRPKELSVDFLNNKFPFIIPDIVRKFLIKNWNSIDLFKFEVKNNKFLNLILYEVKSNNFKYIKYGKYKKTTLTHHTFEIYNQALKLGFDVFIVKIIYYKNWEYSCMVKKFNSKDFIIYDGNKKYSFKK